MRPDDFRRWTHDTHRVHVDDAVFPGALDSATETVRHSELHAGGEVPIAPCIIAAEAALACVQPAALLQDAGKFFDADLVPFRSGA